MLFMYDYNIVELLIPPQKMADLTHNGSLSR